MDRPTPAILLVENDNDAAGAMVELLESHGFSVVTTQSGEQALVEMRQHGRPCLLLCGFVLSDMNGRELANRVLADPALAATPLVMVTGMPPAAAPAGLQILRKPFSVHDLISLVEGYCRRGTGCESSRESPK
jgi:CheY-like chemotaxis protein